MPALTARNAWQAISERPFGFIASSWPWRSVAYLASGVVLGALTAVVLIGLVVAGTLGALLVVGLVAFLAVALSGVAVGRLERWRLRLVDRDPLPDPHKPPVRAGRRLAWLRFRLREPATWRELGYTIVSLGALWWIDAAMLGIVLGIPITLGATPFIAAEEVGPVGRVAYLTAALALLPFAAYPITVWAGARAAPGPSSPRATPSWASSWSRWPAPGPAWSTRSTSNGGASSGTCTTAPSSVWSRSPSRSAWPGSRCRPARRRPGTSPTPRSRPSGPTPNCAS